MEEEELTKWDLIELLRIELAKLLFTSEVSEEEKLNRLQRAQEIFQKGDI